jgi:small-conductance mechanosensitive channel
LIPPEVIPGRMTLLVTLFLVLINIFNSITNNSPNTETITAISIWIITCILFVFGALSSYAVILYRKYKTSSASLFPPSKISMTAEKEARESVKKELKLKQIDNVLLRLFPLLFIVFNFVYWPFFLS